MNEYLARLNSAERRFLVAVVVLLFLVFNIFWVWPHFSDWGDLQRRLTSARAKLASYEAVIQQRAAIESELRKLQGEGLAVPPEDQTTEFFRTIQTQALQNGVNFIGNSRPTARTNNQFFVEQILTVQVQSTEKQLVEFLYNLGAANSLIRVRALSVHPDPSRQQLSANITLVASYQKNPKPQAAPPPAAVAGANPPKPALKPAVLKTSTPPAQPAPGKPATKKIK